MRSSNQSFARRSAARQRGVVLVFVVAVLVLLAIIATTYLAMARIDRVNPEIRGGLAGGLDDDIPLPLEELRLDLYDWKAQANLPADNSGTPFDITPYQYRPAEGVAGTQYQDFDYLNENGSLFSGDYTQSEYNTRQQHDPYLASRVPLPLNGAAYVLTGGTGSYPAWPKISRWIERWTDSGWVFNSTDFPNHIGTFESPLGTGSVASPQNPPLRYTTCNMVIPTYVRVDYGVGFKSPPEFDGKTAIYPAFAFAPGSADSGKIVIAGDADGDGVADCGLFPLAFADDLTIKRPDITISANTFVGDNKPHVRRWYAGVRIVDANDAINVNTAWRRNADIQIGSPDVGTNDLTTSGGYPNYGFFLSNVGLYELLFSDSTRIPLAPQYAQQWTDFTNLRFGGIPPTSSASGQPNYVFTTLGEALQMQLGRRPFNPGSDGVRLYHGFSEGLASSFAFMNGLINPRESRSDLENVFKYDLYMHAPNWGAADDKDTDKETHSFTFFSAPSTMTAPAAVPGNTSLGTPYLANTLWWNAFYNPDDTSRNTFFSTPANFGGTAAYGGATPPPRTVRQYLTTSNPQSTSARSLAKVAGQPAWLTGSATVCAAHPMQPFPNDSHPKASINTDPFSVLWRQFYMTLADPSVATFDKLVGTNDITGNGGDTITLTNDQDRLYLRSALAAVNAIDQRDGDDDLTTYTLMLGGHRVVIAGAERQLVISKVLKNPAGDAFDVTITNPYPLTADPADTIDPRAYYVAFLGTGGAYLNIQQVGTTAMPGGSTLVKSNMTIPTAISGGSVVLLRTRRSDGVVTSDATAGYSESVTTGADLVCVDRVKVTDFAAVPSGGTYTRATTWAIASCGTDFLNPSGGAVENPICLDNRPSVPLAVKRANQATNNQFPCGGFARNGDMMMIPFVGHYSFFNGANLEDVVPITLDVQKVTKAPAGQLTGRFVPPIPVAGDWRARIFDNFTAQANPMNDLTPNIAKESWLTRVAGRSDPLDVKANDPSAPSENVSPVQGLINVNTADQKVLEMVPFITDTTTGTMTSADITTNQNIAAAIIAYRRANGPFKSVVDILQAFSQTANNPVQGNFLDTTRGGDVATFANKYSVFIRVSNLLTTRSDSYIVYVVLQQWQDFGTTQPLLVPGSEKRLAATVDRSRFTDFNVDNFIKESISTN